MSASTDWRAADGLWPCLVLVHALIREAQGLDRIGRVLGHEHHAMGCGHVEHVSVLAQRVHRRVEDARGVRGIIDGGKHAELVAAHAVGDRGRNGLAQAFAEAREQGVARRVAEGVVIGLEAVEVEQREQHEPVGVGDVAVHVAHQRAPVAEPGEGIRQRLVTARREHGEVLGEGDAQAQDHGHHRRGGEREGDGVDAVKMVVHQHGQAGRADDRGDREQRPALDARTGRADGGLPGSQRQQREGDRPAGVEERFLDVGAVRRLVQVDRVDDRERDQAGGDQGPRTARPPAAQADHADHEGEQQRVAEGEGEVRQHGAGRPAGLGEHHGEHERASDSGDAECPDQTVEPDARREAADLIAGEQDECDECAGVEADVERVAHRRIGHDVEAGEHERPVQVGRPEAHDAEREHQPGRAGAGDKGRPGEAAHERAELDEVVAPVAQPAQRPGQVLEPEVSDHHDGDKQPGGDDGDDADPPVEGCMPHTPRIGVTSRALYLRSSDLPPLHVRDGQGTLPAP